METDQTVSHCHNIRSRQKSNLRCLHPASHGDYCGTHYKNPVRFTAITVITVITDTEKTAVKIQKWWMFWRGIRAVKTRGIGYWDRSLNTNDTDFFSTDPVKDISGQYFFSYKDADRHVYGFDVRSIHSLFERSRNDDVLNPFTRVAIPHEVQKKVEYLIQWLQKRKLSTEWEALHPPSPEQQWRMRIVDLFNIIDGLNYYSSPDWFIELNHHGHKRFYREMYDIWAHRAGLSSAQREQIVPNHAQLIFRYPPWVLVDLSMEALRKLNTRLIRILISSAVDREDRILGAMYVISTLTLVNRGARLAYPWLYESVSLLPDNVLATGIHGLGPIPEIPGFGWIHAVLNFTGNDYI